MTDLRPTTAAPIVAPPAVPTVALPAVLPTPTPPAEAGLDTALFAWEWARRLAGTSWVVDDRRRIAEQLCGFTQNLVTALDAEPFSAEPGIEVGEGLVRIGFAAPEALARTSTLFLQRFLGELGVLDASYADRLAELIGTLGLGFVRAVRARTLEQQEAIRGSALLAWERAVALQKANALRDTVTGLLNRPGFICRLGELIDQRPHGVVGVCLLSLNGFDALDRALGRSIGDRLLVTVAGRLGAGFARDGEIVARVGRDEFLVAGIDVAGDDSPPDTMANRLLTAQSAISEPIMLDGRAVVLTTSCGLLARPAASTDPELLLRDAVLAASWALARGPGSVAMFDAARAAAQISDLTLTAELPAAIRDGRVQPHYQPIVSLRTGRIQAVEALARWQHDEHGLLHPERFLHLAESGGMIGRLGHAILLQACTQARTWSLTGPGQPGQPPPVVAVNLAATQIADPQTVRDVVMLLEETQLPAHLLQLEITEHSALNQPGTLRVIRDLAGVGVGLALDDFGTGRAHLAQLPEMPAHGVRTLKLPADFLQHSAPEPVPGAGAATVPGADEARLYTFAAMIDLAHRLGLQVTVEGVETAEHDNLVRRLGADLAQGSYYAPPETAEAITALLRSY